MVMMGRAGIGLAARASGFIEDRAVYADRVVVQRSAGVVFVGGGGGGAEGEGAEFGLGQS